MTTRERLLDSAEYLFARSSIAGVTTREIVEAAGQRNVSSISYHFGSREGLLIALLARRGGPVDDERSRLRNALGPTPSLSELVGCLVTPLTDLLRTEEGRSYIRIVAQLRGRFAYWRLESDAVTAANLIGILDEIERRPGLSDALRAERLLSMIMLMTASAAGRAASLDDRVSQDLSHSEYVGNLIDMCAAIIEA